MKQILRWKSRKGMILLTLAMLGVIIGFIAFLVISTEEATEREQRFIGENALAILRADQKAQLVLAYLDMAALFATREGILLLAEYGGIAADTHCGVYAGYSIWQAPVREERRTERCVPEHIDGELSLLISRLIDEHTRGLLVSDQTTYETYQLPINNYQIALRQDGDLLDVIGNARDDLYFQVRRDRVVAYAPERTQPPPPPADEPRQRDEPPLGAPREEGLMLTINYPFSNGKAYLPKGTRARDHLPVLVLLHGGLGSPALRTSAQQFLAGSYRFERFIDQKIEQGRMRPILVIAPRDHQSNAISMWNEDHFTVQELLDRVEAMLPDGIRIDRNQLYVGGHSNGGVFREDLPGTSGVHRSILHDDLAGAMVFDGSMQPAAAEFIREHAPEEMRLFTYQAKNNRGEHGLSYAYADALADGRSNTEDCGIEYDQGFFAYCKKVKGREWYHYLTARGGPGLCDARYAAETPQNNQCRQVNSDVHYNVVTRFRDDWLTRLFQPDMESTGASAARETPDDNAAARIPPPTIGSTGADAEDAGENVIVGDYTINPAFRVSVDYNMDDYAALQETVFGGDGLITRIEECERRGDAIGVCIQSTLEHLNQKSAALDRAQMTIVEGPCDPEENIRSDLVEGYLDCAASEGSTCTCNIRLEQAPQNDRAPVQIILTKGRPAHRGRDVDSQINDIGTHAVRELDGTLRFFEPEEIRIDIPPDGKDITLYKTQDTLYYVQDESALSVPACAMHKRTLKFCAKKEGGASPALALWRLVDGTPTLQGPQYRFALTLLDTRVPEPTAVSPEPPEVIVSGRRVGIIGSSWVADGRFVRTLAEHCPGYTFERHGYPGQGTAFHLSHFEEDIIRNRYDQVIIVTTINDLDNQRRSLESVKNNLAQMYQHASDAGMRVIATVVFPWQGYGESRLDASQSEFRHRRTQDLNAWIGAVAPNVDAVVDTRDALANPDRPAYMNPAYTNDGAHMNARGNRVLGEEMFEQAFRGLEGCAP